MEPWKIAAKCPFEGHRALGHAHPLAPAPANAGNPGEDGAPPRRSPRGTPRANPRLAPARSEGTPGRRARAPPLAREIHRTRPPSLADCPVFPRPPPPPLLAVRGGGHAAAHSRPQGTRRGPSRAARSRARRFPRDRPRGTLHPSPTRANPNAERSSSIRPVSVASSVPSRSHPRRRFPPRIRIRLRIRLVRALSVGTPRG